MAKGYHFKQLNRENALLTTTLTGTEIQVVNSYSFSDTNIYNIVIEKDTVQAKLTVTGDKGQYTMSTSGIPTQTVSDGVTTIDAYLGKTLTFSYVETDREKLDYYYYTDSEGEHRIPGDAENPITLTLTSALLEKLGNKVALSSGKLGYVLNIAVKTIAKYNLTYDIINDLYAENYAITLEDKTTNYVSGTNVLDGTKVIVNVVAKDNNPDAETEADVAKYIITLSDCVNQTYLLGEVEDLEIVIDADKTLKITITQKSYTTASEQGIYNSIDRYNSLTPDDLAAGEDIANFEMANSLQYGNIATVKFMRINPGKGELAVIRLERNDSHKLVVHIKDSVITSVYDETDNKEYVVVPLNAKHTTCATPAEVVQVANLFEQLKSLGYTLKMISGITEKVELEFIVKNTIKITAEYKCYKRITTVI